MRVPMSVALSAMLASSAPAAAGDFTGVYAGVNAGYAFGRSGDGQRLAPAPTSSTMAPETGLPPIALSAAGRLEYKRGGSRNAGAR